MISLLTSFFNFHHFAILDDFAGHAPGTQFLYRFPPKLPPDGAASAAKTEYNIYEKKALAPYASG
jgi:hypothetical protein